MPCVNGHAEPRTRVWTCKLVMFMPYVLFVCARLNVNNDASTCFHPDNYWCSPHYWGTSTVPSRLPAAIAFKLVMLFMHVILLPCVHTSQTSFTSCRLRHTGIYHWVCSRGLKYTCREFFIHAQGQKLTTRVADHIQMVEGDRLIV